MIEAAGAITQFLRLTFLPPIERFEPGNAPIIVTGIGLGARNCQEDQDGTIQYDDAEIPQGSWRYLAAGHRALREENLAGKGKLKVKMVLTSEGTSLHHVVEGEIDLSDAHF